MKAKAVEANRPKDEANDAVGPFVIRRAEAIALYDYWVKEAEQAAREASNWGFSEIFTSKIAQSSYAAERASYWSSKLKEPRE